MRNPWEVATWRYELIAPLLDPTLTRAQRQKIRKTLAKTAFPWPSEKSARTKRRRGVARRVSRASIARWLRAYRTRGIEGLLPARKKRGPKKPAAVVDPWITHAIRLLFEEPDRSLYQLALYLEAKFPDFSLPRSTLHRRIRSHPSYDAIVKMRQGPKRRLRTTFAASRPHQLWQLDGKGPFPVKLVRGGSVRVHVLSILDDCTRMVLGAIIARAEDVAAAVRVFRRAACLWGLPDRIQYDRGSAFESWTFRGGLAQLGSHRNWIEARNPEADGKIERYHQNLERWFVKEIPHQQVLDLVHLEELLQATIELAYNDHFHSELGRSPRTALAGRTSDRRVTETELRRVFWEKARETSQRKTGQVRLGNWLFRVPARYAGETRTFRYDPVDPLATLVLADDREIPLEVVETKRPFDAPPKEPRRGTGELQRLLDRWRGQERPVAEPGFGLPEVFALLSEMSGRETPSTEDEARLIRGFYERHGPLLATDFRLALSRTQAELGAGRALTAYLDHLERQIRAAKKSVTPPNSNPLDPIGEPNP